MESDQAEQLDVLLKALNKNWDAEETNASATWKWENRFPFPFDNQDTQTERVMAEKKVTNFI